MTYGFRFDIGQQVFVRSVGLGRVTDHAGRDRSGRPVRLEPGQPPHFHVVATAARVVIVPIETAGELLRPLVSVDVATSMLAILRAPETTPGPDLDDARALRELYALPALDHRQAITLLHHEDLVVDEIAAVLGEDRDALIDEMRARYPAFANRVADNRAGRSSDGPIVDAVPVQPVPPGLET